MKNFIDFNFNKSLSVLESFIRPRIIIRPRFFLQTIYYTDQLLISVVDYIYLYM